MKEDLYTLALAWLVDMIADSELEIMQSKEKCNDYWNGYMTGQLNGLLTAKAIIATAYNEVLRGKE